MKNTEKSEKGKFSYDKGHVFMRDSFVPFADAHVSIASSPVLYGLAIYTVLSLNHDKSGKKLFAFRLEDHFKRLIDSAKIMDFGEFIKDWDFNKFERMIEDLVEKNRLAESSGDFLIRISVFIDALVAGTKIRGLPNALYAYAYPMGEIVPRSGIHVCVSSYCRLPDNVIPARAKVNGGYVNVALMKNESLMNGYDDALALDRNGYVTEGTVANIFILRDGVLITPSLNLDILEGITRNSIIRIAKDMGMKIVERAIARSELYVADEAFICGTSARITPILSIDRREVGEGKQGLFTKKISQRYEEIQRGIVKEYREWRQEI